MNTAPEFSVKLNLNAIELARWSAQQNIESAEHWRAIGYTTTDPSCRLAAFVQADRCEIWAAQDFARAEALEARN